MRIGSKWNGTAWMALALAAMAGCESEPLPGEHEQAINGTATFTGDWDPAQMDRIRAALPRARERVASAAMLNCLKESQMAGPNTVPGQTIGTGYPEWIQSKMLQDLPTNFTAPQYHISAAVGIPYEEVFGLGGLTDPESLVASILHEVGHNKGFTHVLTEEMGLAVPDQLSSCSRGIGEGGGLTGFAVIARSAMKHESTLAPVGLPKGEGAGVSCPGTQFAAGILGSTKMGIRVGLTCQERGGTVRTDGELLGSVFRGVNFSRSCPAGSLMVGAWGAANEGLSGIAPLCATEFQIFAGSGFSERLAIAGTRHGLGWERRCPVGMAVKELRGRTVTINGVLQSLEITCQRIDNPQPILRTRFPEVGVRGAVSTVARESCLGRSVLTGLLVTSASAVARIAGFCDPVSTSAAGVDFLDGYGTWLPGVGAHGDSNAVDASSYCPDSHALVGLRIAGGSPISAVQGVCAPVSEWDTPAAIAPFALTPWLGGAPAAPITEQACPRRQFVSGLSVGAAERVHLLGIECRDFQGAAP